MKAILRILSYVMILFIPVISTLPLSAQDIVPEDDESYIVYLSPENPDPERGQRMPSRLLFCSISRVDGIQISGIENAEIVSFEILDAYGNTVAILQDEPSFIETIFSLNGKYLVIFCLSDRSFAGWTEIE